MKMRFERLDSGRLRVALSGADLLRYRLTYEDIDYRSDETRAALLDLLRRAREEEGYSPPSGKLYVEIYPTGDGCVVYFDSDLPEGFPAGEAADPARVILPRPDPPGPADVCPCVVFAFASCDDMIEGCTQVFSRFCHRIRKSALYSLEGLFCLVIHPLDGVRGLACSFLCEYARPVEGGPLLPWYIAEHGRPVVEENAVDVISYYFA